MQLPQRASTRTWRSSSPRSRRELLKPSTPRAASPRTLARSSCPLRGCFHIWAEPHEGVPEHLPVWRGIPPSALQLPPAFWPAGKRAEPLPRSAQALAACPSAHNLFKESSFFFATLLQSDAHSLPCFFFFSPSLPTYETLVKHWAGSDTLPALREVKQRRG